LKVIKTGDLHQLGLLLDLHVEGGNLYVSFVVSTARTGAMVVLR